MRVENGVLSFSHNGEDLGIAYEDEGLMGDDLVPFIKLGRGDSVTVLTGEVI